MGVFRLYKAAAPFNASELPEVDYVQSFDVMYMAHLNYDPIKLSRTGHTSWLFTGLTFGPSIAPPTGVNVTATAPNVDADNSGNAYFPQTDSYVVTVVAADTGQESRASTADTGLNDLSLKRNFNTIGWSASTGAERYRVYKAHNDGDYGFIGSTETLSFVDDNIGSDLTVGPPEGRNPFSGSGNKPSTVTFYEQRLWWGRTLNNPNALFSSRSADFENMDVSVPLRADDAITIRLVTQGVNQANQLVPSSNLLVLGSDGVFKIVGSNEDYLAASPPPRQSLETSTGASRLSAIKIDGVTFFKTATGEEVRALGYRFDADGYKSNDVTIFSPQFFEGFDIVSWCYAQYPLSVIWAARSDGALLAFTWEEANDVWGWTICPLAGDGKVKSLCAVKEGGESRVYAVIERTIAGVTRTFRERMASARWRGLHNENHLDCSVSRFFDDPTNVVDGLWHLEGETVAAFADGVEYDDLVVVNGAVTLPEEVTCQTAHVGLPFDAILETLPLNFQTPQGVSHGRRQQSGTATVKLVRSRGVRIGVKDDKLRPIKTGANYALLTSEDSLLNGEFPINTDPKVAFETTAIIQQRIAPMTITAVYLDVSASSD